MRSSEGTLQQVGLVDTHFLCDGVPVLSPFCCVRLVPTGGDGATLFLPFTEGGPWEGHRRHASAADMDKIWARERRKTEHVADRLTNVAFGGIKHRSDGKMMSAHNMAEGAAEALVAA